MREIHAKDSAVRRSVIGAKPEMRELMSSLFHDLREPLRTIQLSLELLETGGDAVKDPGLWLRRARQNTSRILKLINDFEDTALSARSAPTSDVQMDEALEAAKAALAASIRTSQAIITSSALPRIRGNSTALSRVFQNLLSNAMKYRREERPIIHVSCRRSGGNWVFSVTDNGIGIGIADRRHIFDPFKRIDTQTMREGSGLGLTICQRIIELHGGHIWLGVSTERGSTFCFTLPRHEEIQPRGCDHATIIGRVVPGPLVHSPHIARAACAR